MEVTEVDVPFEELSEYVERNFREVAQEKGLEFEVNLSKVLPPTITTDWQRLQQVIRNLLSNSFKFTEQGHVKLDVNPVKDGWSRHIESLSKAEKVIAFSVSDTGIGIPLHRQKLVFEAFQQGDGTTSRKYGGTGLGLSISREIASLLGGEIRLISSPGEGSTFTLYLPAKRPAGSQRSTGSKPRAESLSAGPDTEAESGAAPNAETANAEPSESAAASATASAEPERVPDDRSDIQVGDEIMLIIEDDPTFASVLLDLAREQGFKGIVATTGEVGTSLVRHYQPSAITLDIRLPDVDGYTVLDRLKHDPETRHIPVHIISATEDPIRGLRQGAIAHLQKPVSREDLTKALADIKTFIERKVRRLLLVEDDETQRNSIVELIGNGDVQTAAVSSGKEALEALKSERFDCMVLDLGLPDMTGFELIEQIRKDRSLTDLPIVIYTGKDLTRKQETELRRLADTIIVKDAKSPERLLDETTLFLHRVQAGLPSSQKQMLEHARLVDPVLAGKKILVVDDDVRNIFALTNLLEQRQMQVLFSENGNDAIEMLKSDGTINIVLMDVMMPELDGYETMRAIRKIPKFKSLPIIALTAKAMKGDRETCIEAGASDYISKPVDTEQLLSLLRVWLYK
jgi:CheY-like chemotaxis protein